MWEAPEPRLGHRHGYILTVMTFYKHKGGTEKSENASGLISTLTLQGGVSVCPEDGKVAP